MKAVLALTLVVVGGALNVRSSNDDESCAASDLKRRAQVQNKLASVCEDMCKEVGAYPKCSQCPAFVPPDATPGVMTWEELLTHMDNLSSWGHEELKSWTKTASALQTMSAVTEEACVAEDLKRRVQVQNKLASVCEDMCKEVGAYPKCSQCPAFVPPDATPGVMTWEELLTHMDNLSSWGHEELKAWTKTASALQTSNAEDAKACVTEDTKRRAQLQNKLASVCEDMCKEVGAYPKCSQCPAFVPPDATPGVMTWEELLTHMDNLSSWGHGELKAWTKTASGFIQQGNESAGNSSNSTDLVNTLDRSYAGFKEDWHQEWRRGDFPAWQETHTTAWMDNSYNRYQPKDYTDTQSDGKPSLAK